MPKNYNILCCDGGGIRGLIPAMIINNLASSPNSTFLSNTSLFAGTSTGGIIAVGLAAGLQPSDIVGLYENSCGSIFGTSPAAAVSDMQTYIEKLVPSKYSSYASTIGEAIALLDDSGDIPANLFSAKYSNASLQALLTKTFQNCPANIESIKPVCVTTFMLDNGSTNNWTPTTIDNLPGAAYGACPLIDAALSTGAAPTFFPPFNNSTLGQYCVDGGTFANNPSMLVLAKVLSLLSQLGIQQSNIRLLSIGTGQTNNAVPSSYFSSTAAANLWGTYQYMFPEAPAATMPSELLINLMMDGSSIINDQQVNAILNSAGNNVQYLRVNPVLDTQVTLDDCSLVSTLEGIVNAFWTTNGSSIQDWVNTNFV